MIRRKTARLALLALATLPAFAALPGCAIMNDDRPVRTQSRATLTANEIENWTNRQARRDKAAYWASEDERLSALRLREFVD